MIPLATLAHRYKVVVVGVGTTDELTRPNDRVRSKPAFVCTGALASSNECPTLPLPVFGDKTAR